jgi:hypothetical protein
LLLSLPLPLLLLVLLLPCLCAVDRQLYILQLPTEGLWESLQMQ